MLPDAVYPVAKSRSKSEEAQPKRDSADSTLSDVFSEDLDLDGIGISRSDPKFTNPGFVQKSVAALTFVMSSESESESESDDQSSMSSPRLRLQSTKTDRGVRESFENLPDLPDSIVIDSGSSPKKEEHHTRTLGGSLAENGSSTSSTRRKKREKPRSQPAAGNPPAHESAEAIAAAVVVG